MLKNLLGSGDRAPTEAEIDRGAKALRQRQMEGRITRAWDATPKSDQKKWRDHAEAVLKAAYRSS